MTPTHKQRHKQEHIGDFFDTRACACHIALVRNKLKSDTHTLSGFFHHIYCELMKSTVTFLCVFIFQLRQTKEWKTSIKQITVRGEGKKCKTNKSRLFDRWKDYKTVKTWDKTLLKDIVQLKTVWLTFVSRSICVVISFARRWNHFRPPSFHRCRPKAFHPIEIRNWKCDNFQLRENYIKLLNVCNEGEETSIKQKTDEETFNTKSRW